MEGEQAERAEAGADGQLAAGIASLRQAARMTMSGDGQLHRQEQEGNG